MGGRWQVCRGVLLLGVIAVIGLSACAVSFGPSDSADSSGLRERNRLFLEEQQRLERERQRFDIYTPGER